MSPGHEHLASAVIRRVLESLANSVMPGPEAPGLVVATPAGQIHEFGALFVAAAAATQGWRVTYLGTDLPASDIAECGAKHFRIGDCRQPGVPGERPEARG